MRDISRGARILIVDDQRGIRRLLEEFCTLLGYTVESAPSGLEALNLAQAGKFNLALIDVRMPGISGLETMLRLRALDPAMKIIFMSGFAEVDLVNQELLAPDIKILAKPFDLKILEAILQESLSEQELENQIIS